MRRLLLVLVLALALLVGSAAPASAHRRRPHSHRARILAADTCAGARARNLSPLPAGAVERCSSPVYNWGATDGTTIYYSPRKIARSGASRGLWAYVVAHERGHARLFAADPLGTHWLNERAADAEAARYYPAEVKRWSPYRRR